MKFSCVPVFCALSVLNESLLNIVDLNRKDT